MLRYVSVCLNFKITLLKIYRIMACGCQKNKGNNVAANKAVKTQTRPSNPTSNGRVSSGRIEKRIIR
jgi:hypothetical protein